MNELKPSSSKSRTSKSARGRSPFLRGENVWPLQRAKSHFSEIVRRAREGRPQHVTVRGREAVVILSENEYRRLKGAKTGKMLVDLLASSPLQGVAFGEDRTEGPVRDIEL